MTANEFIATINTSSNDKIQGIVDCAINDFTQVTDYQTVISQISNIDAKDFTNLGDKIVSCMYICDKKLKDIDGLESSPYKEKLNLFLQFLNELVSIIRTEGNVRAEQQKKLSDTSDKKYVELQNIDVLREQLIKLNKLQESATDALKKSEKTQEELDSKIFSLLINTVAILGIFVAIAFAGLGITSLFSDLDFATAFASKENFIRTVFFLFLVALLSYNLLLLLIYFIYKLSRPIFMGTVETTDKGNSKRFKDSIELKPFYVVDGILFAVLIALFTWGIFTFSNDNNVSPDENSYVNSETISGEADTGSETTDGEETT